MPGAIPSETVEGTGKAGCPLHPAHAQKTVCARALTTGTGGITPAFPAQWFMAYFALSPVNQLVATVVFERRMPPRKLSACMGAPGPHDFVVREQRRSSVGPFHRIPPRVRDDASAPPAEAGRADHTPDSIFRKTGFFFCYGSLTGFWRCCPVGQISRGISMGAFALGKSILGLCAKPTRRAQSSSFATRDPRRPRPVTSRRLLRVNRTWSRRGPIDANDPTATSPVYRTTNLRIYAG
jgi:hypothetical protein